MDKGRVSCPTCQAVGRKTIEGLKKHMENCKQVRYFVAFHDSYMMLFYPKFSTWHCVGYVDECGEEATLGHRENIGRGL